MIINRTVGLTKRAGPLDRVKHWTLLAIALFGLATVGLRLNSTIRRANDDIRQGRSLVSQEDEPILRQSLLYRYNLEPGHDVLAEACIADYDHRSPLRDAKEEASRVAPRFNYYVSNGYAEFPVAAGLSRNCSPSWGDNVRDIHFRHQREYNSITGDGGFVSPKTRQCMKKMIDYQAVFNKRLAILRPDMLKVACFIPQNQ